MHWNLPSNPVDLEQRDGRINRRDGLAIRRAIAADIALDEARRYAGEARNPWDWVFGAVEASPGLQRYKHGLSPHWVYETADGRAAGIRRHLLFFRHSRDAERYERLRKGLALYRLVFGQPRQEDLLHELEQRFQDAGADPATPDLHRRLPAYMINLAPFDRGYAWERAEIEAEALEGDVEAVQRLAEDVRCILIDRKTALGAVEREVMSLLHLVLNLDGATGPDRRRRRRALAALVYLRNPYDAEFDTNPEVGLEDDIAVIRDVYRRSFANHT